MSSYPWLSTFLTDTRETVAPSRGTKDGLLPPLLVAVAVIAVAWTRNPRTPRYSAP